MSGNRKAKDFIKRNLRLSAHPFVPEISLYSAHPSSGLSRLLGETSQPPFWAYPWAGGLILARYLLDNPGVVARLRVADLGSGSGLVALAAAKAGARAVQAIEADRNGAAAIALNAAANAVTLEIAHRDALEGPPPDADLVLAGDVFYDPTLACRTLTYLQRCHGAGQKVLIGDPGRPDLPRGALALVHGCDVPDFGIGQSQAGAGGVFTLRPL